MLHHDIPDIGDLCTKWQGLQPVPHRRSLVGMEHDDRLLEAVGARQDAVIALTQALIRIPTLNPPGRNYLEICEMLGARLSAKGFAVELIRAHGAPADS